MSEEQNVIVPVHQLLPEELFIIPIKQRPIFPGMVSPLIITGKDFSSKVENILKKTTYLGLLIQRDNIDKAEDPDNLYSVGTAIKVIKSVNLPDGGIHLLINSLQRFSIKKYTYQKPSLLAKVEYYPEPEVKPDKELQALTRAVFSDAKNFMNANPLFTEEMKFTLVNVSDPGKIADFVCSILSLEKEEYQEILETFELKKRLELTLQFLQREKDLFDLQQKIQFKINDRMDQQQRDFFLREQLRAIKNELGAGTKEKDYDYYKNKVEALQLPDEVHSKVLEEAEKLDYVDPNAGEYGVIRNYLDTILGLPWAEPTYKEIEVEKAIRTLNRDHYGIEDVKERIIEYIAVKKLKKSEKGGIICLVGPPGVGKTSVGRSIARALNKKFFRFSVGGMRDEAEIKGHRKTYLGAMPGKLIQAIKAVQSKDPVLMLDEIDKMGVSYQGDPASALLEVLDPEQNRDFRDHYLDLPYDLSSVLFITTANTLDTIPMPLLDRMEIIRLPGYILEEKIHIARKYLIPKVLEETGFSKKNAPAISMPALKSLIGNYAREAGVRSLEKSIHKVYRKVASLKIQKMKVPASIEVEKLDSYLGPPRFKPEDPSMKLAVGTAMGLAWTSLGGATLPIECIKITGKQKIQITGQLGKVMSESAEIAVSYVKALISDESFWSSHTIHIHAPDGATPKDGPSAGVTLSSALLSLYFSYPVKDGYAMTGEINLQGDILPIGGLREKVGAAKRLGIKKILFPNANLSDWERLPSSLTKGMKPFPISTYNEAGILLFGKKFQVVASSKS
jgi:ATP-dependent Lon protease